MLAADDTGGIARLYAFVRRRRVLYIVCSAVLILIFAGLFTRVQLDATIDVMLPDDDMDVSADFARLQQSPFARKIVVQITGREGGTVSELTAAADRMAAALPELFFHNVIRGPVDFGTPETLNWLTAHVPHLATEADLQELSRSIEPDAVSESLRQAYRQLLAPEGLLEKGLIQQDPLAFRKIALRKLQHLRVVPEVEVVQMHFVSSDRRSALILAETSVSMTDFAGGRRLMDAFAAARAEALSADFEAILICGHRYAVSNAERAQRDAVLVLVLASVGILLLFLVFLRSWRGIFVFLVPISVLAIAAVITAVVYGRLAAITLGFGAVLLGISVDFALHVFFALRTRPPAEHPAALAKVARPLLFGGLTTLAAFAVMLFSAMPGQRQLAVFSIVGLTAALLLALVILPHLLGQGGTPLELASVRRDRSRYRSLIIGAWFVLMLLALWPAAGLIFSGDLRLMNYVPDDLAQDEQVFRETWGDMRSQAMLFAEGSDLQAALEANDRLYAALAPRLPEGTLVSVSPLMPSLATQATNLQRWREYWDPARVAALRQILIREGRALGFADDAFALFLEWLVSPPPPFALDALAEAGLDELVRSMRTQTPDGVAMISLAPDHASTLSIFEEHVRDDALHLVSQTAFGQALGRVIARDVKRFLFAAVLLVTVLLVLLFRNLKKVVVALVPVVTGLLVMAALMALFQLPVTPVNLIAGILVIGLGVDYGIFMVERCVCGHRLGTETAVLVSGLTTLVGFGSLVLAQHPVMRSIGISMSLGISSAMLAALLVIPAIYGAAAERPEEVLNESVDE